MYYVVAALEGRDGRSVGRGASDAEFLHLAHERGLGVARRCLCKPLCGCSLLHVESVAGSQRGEKRAVYLHRGTVVVDVGSVDFHEALEHKGLARGTEYVGTAADGDVDAGLLETRLAHLRCDSAFPDQAVELLLLRRALYGAFADICWADCLMCLLGTLRAGVVTAHVKIAVAICAGDLGGNVAEREFGEVGRVGSHVGDVSLLIELLGHAHGGVDRESELAPGLLLECRCGERRRGPACGRLACHVGDCETRRGAGVEKRPGIGLGAETARAFSL